MRTFERRALIGLALVTSLVAMWSCGSSSTCLRYSDCDQGLTCANGLCVIAGGDGDGGDDGGDDDGGATTPTPTTTATPVTDAGTDAGSETVDAMTTDATSDDAAIADASTD
jgi:hypothetical protein